MTRITRRTFLHFFGASLLGFVAGCRGCKGRRDHSSIAPPTPRTMGPKIKSPKTTLSSPEALARQALDLTPLSRALERVSRGTHSAQVAKQLYMVNQARPIEELIGRGEEAFLREIIRQGDFLTSSLAANSLAFSERPQADLTIERMIGAAKNKFERSAGMIILCLRLARRNASFNYEKIIAKHAGGAYSFLSAPLQTFRNLKAVGKWNHDSLPPGWLTDEMFLITSFFRHPQALEALVRFLPPEPQNIWDIGCSIGQGTLSAWIHLSEKRPEILGKIIGTDISPLALSFAARGIYEAGAPSLQSKFGMLPLTNEAAVQEHFRSYEIPAAHLSRYLQSSVRRLDGKVLYQATSLGEQRIGFAYDDIGQGKSVVADRSIGAALYFNVHYLLSEKNKPKALEKIRRKARRGGLVLVQDPYLKKDMSQFTKIFGDPIHKFSGQRAIEDILVFRLAS